MKTHYEGIVTKLKVLKPAEPTLVLAQLQTKDELMTLLIAKKALTFLLEVQENDSLSVFGHYNARQQFVVDRYWVKSHAHADLPSHLRYPTTKKYRPEEA
ncbi:MAG: hypothetical protein Q4B80_06300 [Aerococcaceae bacterium]|nr:hypothetical protein [Aerococcaceae bacterium]